MAEQTDRAKRFAARQEQLKARMPKTPVVRVEPATDVLRRALKHPRGHAFTAEGSVEWPLDRFTHRRIADGSVKVVEKDKDRGDAPKQQHEQQPRTRAPTPSSGTTAA